MYLGIDLGTSTPTEEAIAAAVDRVLTETRFRDRAGVLAAEIAGDADARAIQLTLEYDPQPPFDAGHPSRPDADPTQVARAMDDARRDRGPLVARAAERLREGR